MSEADQKTKPDIYDVAAGIVMVIVGGIAALQASEFDDASKMFPLFLAALLAVTGLAIAIHAFVKPTQAEPRPRNLSMVLIAAFVVASWGAAFAGGAGFVLPTFMMLAALFWLAGLRQPNYVASIAAMVTFFAYLLFVKLLDVPLPQSILPGVLEGF